MISTSAKVDQPAPNAAQAAAAPHMGIGYSRKHTGEKLNGQDQKQLRRRVAVTHAIWGLALGAAVLHPMAVVICELYRLCGQTAGSRNVLEVAAAPFGPGMLHGVVAFALFGFVTGLLEGHFTGVIRSQRDELAQQLEINLAYRDELEAKNSALLDMEEMKHRMTRFLVHDLKNHIGCVLGYTNLQLKRAQENDWPQRDQNVLTAVIRQAERMSGAVCDVLEQARLEHRPWMRLRPSQAIDILRDARASVALNPREGRVGIDPDAPEDFLVTCEPRWIVRVLANLVLNAIRHNPRGAQVTVGVKREDREAVFFCTDDGKGIPRSIRNRVFGEFASETHSDESVHSFGLGLSFCKTAVEAQGGRIWFETSDGTGTTFFFTIPISSKRGPQNGRTCRVVTNSPVVTMSTSPWYAYGTESTAKGG